MFENISDLTSLSNAIQDMFPYFFRCEEQCDLTNFFAAGIVVLFTITIFAIQIHLAREHEQLRSFIIRNKLRNDVYYLLYQMRMLQPYAYEKKLITDLERNQIISIAKTVQQIEENLVELKNKLTYDEKTKIENTINFVKQRLEYGLTDLKRNPRRFDYLDFSDSIKEVSNTLPMIS